MIPGAMNQVQLPPGVWAITQLDIQAQHRKDGTIAWLFNPTFTQFLTEGGLALPNPQQEQLDPFSFLKALANSILVVVGQMQELEQQAIAEQAIAEQEAGGN